MSQSIKPKVYRTELLSRRWLSKEVFEITLRRPPGFIFHAGQCVSVRIEETRRDYSLVTAPWQPSLAFCVRHVEGGALSPALAFLEEGAELCFNGPHGYFIYRESPLKPVFVATGTGIAPFVSMARAGTKDFIILHGVTTAEELYYREELAETAESYIPCLSEGEKGPPGVFFGMVTEYLENELAEGQYAFYLCGRGEMIRDVTHLVDARFPESLIFSEPF